MVIEIACISLQAARGTTSHYNIATPFDAAVFRMMGSMIGANTLLAGLLLAVFGVQRVDVDRVYLWGIRLGLVFRSWAVPRTWE
ncbi:MAG TPA: hypothetical protein VNB49_09730 [Candidatus Dormibacteraeota bacterium]|nr:hypothetical protein [Candidatus Dormibacteraeota bacterium]